MISIPKPPKEQSSFTENQVPTSSANPQKSIEEKISVLEKSKSTNDGNPKPTFSNVEKVFNSTKIALNQNMIILVILWFGLLTFLFSIWIVIIHFCIVPSFKEATLLALSNGTFIILTIIVVYKIFKKKP